MSIFSNKGYQAYYIIIVSSTVTEIKASVRLFTWNRKVNETYLEVEVCLTFYRPRAPTKVK